MISLKRRLQRGDTVFGTFLCLGDPAATELLGTVGYDWVLIDLEHGGGGEREALQQMMALKGSATEAVVRVECTAPQRAYRMLDAGARGIMFPRVDSAAQAAAAVAALHYPPAGVRGTAKLVRAAGFGPDFAAHRRWAEREALGVIQIETRAAIAEVDAIAATKGVDVLFIGPSDLSMELGVFERWDHPLFLEAITLTLAAARRHAKAVGILLFDADELPHYESLGMRFFACGSDGSLLRQAAKQSLDRLVALRGAQRAPRRRRS